MIDNVRFNGSFVKFLRSFRSFMLVNNESTEPKKQNTVDSVNLIPDSHDSGNQNKAEDISVTITELINSQSLALDQKDLRKKTQEKKALEPASTESKQNERNVNNLEKTIKESNRPKKYKTEKMLYQNNELDKEDNFNVRILRKRQIKKKSFHTIEWAQKKKINKKQNSKSKSKGPNIGQKEKKIQKEKNHKKVNPSIKNKKKKQETIVPYDESFYAVIPDIIRDPILRNEFCLKKIQSLMRRKVN